MVDRHFAEADPHGDRDGKHPACGANQEWFGNDPEIDRMIAEADRDNASKAKGRQAIFFADMNQAVRLWTVIECKGFDKQRLIDFSWRTGEIKETKARWLAKLAPHYDEVICWAEDGYRRAQGRGEGHRHRYAEWTDA
jgi:hypothetical protein